MQSIVLKNKLSEHFTLICYPDGQNSIKLNFNKLNIKEPVRIVCRIRNFGELEILSCLVNALRKNDFYIDNIYFSYLFGMRSDRAFNIGEPNYFRDVVLPVINLLIEDIEILAPHTINYNCHIMPDYPIICPAPSNCLILGGDKSVTNWYGNFLDGFFEKERKENIIVSLKLNHKKHDFDTILIVDDLCDGGATFIAEGKYLKQHFPDKKLKLSIYHGLFTQGIHPLLSYFDEIICTNSYQDIDHPRVTQIKVI